MYKIASTCKIIGQDEKVVAAHRISTIKDANCIYVLHNGKQVGAGTHDELLKTNKYYQSLENGDSYDINRS